jgi:hypothetical protein
MRSTRLALRKVAEITILIVGFVAYLSVTRLDVEEERNRLQAGAELA